MTETSAKLGGDFSRRLKYTTSETASAKIDELMRLDKEDDSLIRYKETLLGSGTIHGDLGNVHDTRRVVIKEFHAIYEGKEANFISELPYSPEDIKNHQIWFRIKEGSNYRLKIVFYVHHEIVSGLRFLLTVKHGVLKRKEEIVMGSYGPRSDPHSFEFPRHNWLQAPKGVFARGEYKAQLCLEDSDGYQHLKLPFIFKIYR